MKYRVRHRVELWLLNLSETDELEERMFATIEHWYSTLKARFFDPLPEEVKNAIKLGLVALAWLMTGNEGLSILPMAVALFFFYRLAGSWKVWMLLLVAGALIGIFNSTGFGFRSHSHLALNSVLFIAPAVVYLKRLTGGIRRRRRP